MKLVVLIEDASADEKARSAAAAEAVFADAGVNPWAAFDALFKADRGEALTEADRQFIRLAGDAERAAAAACCAGWTDRPERIGIAVANLPKEPDRLGLVRREVDGLEIVVARGDELMKLFVQYSVLDVLAEGWGEFVAKAEAHRGRLREIAARKLPLGLLGRDLRVYVNVADLTNPSLRPVRADLSRLTSPPWEEEFSRALALPDAAPDVLH